MDIFSEELRGITAYPEASLTHCNRKGLEMFKCEIITVLFLPFGWTISCLSRNLYQGVHIPAVLHLCFQQVEYCPDQNLKLLTCMEDPEHSMTEEVGNTHAEVVYNNLRDTTDAFLELDQWLML